MKIETIKHKDVYGKEQLYIKITGTNKSGDTKEHVINVGEKTIKQVDTIIEFEKESGKTIEGKIEIK